MPLRSRVSSRRRRLTLLAALLALVECFAAPAAAAQVRGVIESTSGNPLSAVLVQLWREQELVGSRVTDSSGRFGFSPDDSRGATELSARRIGFTATRRFLARGDTVLRIRLEGMADASTRATLARIGAACPNHEDPEARALWQRLRRRYRSADSVGLATLFSASNTVVSPDELGAPGNPAERQGRRALPGTSRIAWRRRVAIDGYAWLQTYRTGDYLTKTWLYPPLESDFAQHFVDHVFGRMHQLSVVSKTEGELVLAFCPTSGRVTALSGLLIVRGDTTLGRVVWRLRTSEPVEEAGGDVVFTDYDASGGLPILLPSRGLVWRTQPDGALQQRWQYYDRWVIDGPDRGRRISMADEEP
jgi:hypothetical protein